jgi:hypothetical protein
LAIWLVIGNDRQTLLAGVVSLKTTAMEHNNYEYRQDFRNYRLIEKEL